jgi:hypothetical protein
MTFAEELLTEFNSMTLVEEFEMFVEDALDGTDVDREELLYLFCNDHLGIAYCDENLEELMEAVVDEPYVLNEYADFLQREI